MYEGVKIPEKGTVGLITYMRTDSTRISDEARAASKNYIISNYGEKYYENRYYKTKQNAQDAHEAIRPTYVELSPDKIKNSLTPEQFKLYNLIYNRFIASQMSTAIYDTTSVDIDVNNYIFKANGQTLKFKGFMTLYVEDNDNGKDKEDIVTLPELEIGQKLEEKKVTEFKNDLYKDFHKTMLTKGYKSMTDCSTSSSICKEITFKDDTKTKFEIDLLAKQIEFNGYKYVLPYSMEVNFLNNYDNECNNSCVSIKEEDNYLIIDVPYFKTVILDEMINDDTFKEEFYNNISKYNLGFKIIYPYNL